MPLAKHAEASKMAAEGVEGGKPGLWSWHLIPTSCRLSEQLQGRTLLLNCNDQFETRQVTFEKSGISVILSVTVQSENVHIACCRLMPEQNMFLFILIN